MWLILKEKHFVQTHVMAVAFSVIFMADLEKRLLVASPLKPFVWKRFIIDIFSLWKIPMEEASIFVNFANLFHPSIKFTFEMSSKHTIFLDTEVFKEFAFHLLEFSIYKPTSSILKLFSIYTSHPATHAIRKGFHQRRSIMSFKNQLSQGELL